MRQRITVLLAMLVISLPIAWWAFVGDGASVLDQQTQIEAVNRSVGNLDALWVREDLFYRVEHNVRNPLRSIPLQRPQFGSSTYTNPDRVRILVVGDSYGEGYGLVDHSVRWGELLEAALDERTQEGTFEVVVLAASGASSFSYAQWIEAIHAGGETLASLTPEEAAIVQQPFDAVVVSFIANDVIAYNGDDVPGGPASYVPVSEWNDVIEHTDQNPHWDYYQSVPARIAAAADSSRLIWLQLYDAAQPTALGSTVGQLFADAGFYIAPTNATSAVHRAHDMDTLLVHPKDHHPNSVLHAAYAADGADAVVATLAPERIARAVAGATRRVRPLVSNALPTYVDIASTATDVTVTSAASATVPWCAVQRNVGGVLECADPYTPIYTVDGAAVAPLHTLCAALGRPYISVTLDRLSVSGRDVVVTNTGAHTMFVGTAGYDPDWWGVTRVFDAPVPPGQSVTFRAGQDAHTVLLGVDGIAGCPTDGSDSVALPAISVTLHVDD